MSLIFPLILIYYVNRNKSDEQEILNVVENITKKDQELNKKRLELEKRQTLHHLAKDAEGKWKLSLTASKK